MTQSPLNIVNLIEHTPITKLSHAYNNKFIVKIKEQFTEVDQQLFVASFYCYLNYNQKTDFVIDFDNVWEWLGFTQKANAKRLLDKHFILDIDYKCLLFPNEEHKDKGSGGHNKETIMLTIKTFKLLCFKAGTKKAHDIQEYYLNLEEILQQIFNEQDNEMKLHCEQILKIKNEELEQVKNEMIYNEEQNKKEFDQKISKEREQFLLREYGMIGSIVYIIKVKTFENGQYIIKIGESRKGVQSRYNEHKSHYSEILLLDCFTVKNSKDFESFLHSHDKIRFNRVSDLEGHETERELFLIGKDLSYTTIITIIKSNIKLFNDYNENETEKYKTQIETLKQIIANLSNPQSVAQTQSYSESTNQEILAGQKELIKLIQNQGICIQNLEKSNKEMSEKINAMQTKTTTNFSQPLATLGPRLQQINPDTLTVIKVYESIAECIKEHNFKLKRPTIVKAIDENVVYNGYRWAFVDRNVDPMISTPIAPTKQTKQQNIGYIAKINEAKTEILNVYLDRKTAAIQNNYNSDSSLDVPVKNASITNGHYYMLYEKCADELKTQFADIHGEPVLYKNGIGHYDSENQLITEYVCKYDCIKQLKISDKTLAKALDKNVLYNNHYFRSIGSKIMI
jgi:hypothetical protein